MSLTLLTGGVRAGKSRLAARLADAASDAVVYSATAVAGDDEMTARIENHRAARPASWRTIEAPLDLAGALSSSGRSFVIVDCLTLWVSNLMHEDVSDKEVLDRSGRALAAALDRAAVVVTNEVGGGIVPANALGRRFQDVLGRVNIQWCAAAADAYLVVAGRALPLVVPSGAADA